MEIGSKIKVLRTRKNLTRGQFAAILGEKPSKIQDVERGKQRINDEFLGKLYKQFDVDLNWLFSNQDQTVSEMETELMKELRDNTSGRSVVDDFHKAERRLVADMKQASTEFWEQATPDPSDYQIIPLYEIDLAAGAGAVSHVEWIAGHLSFRRDWLKRIGLPPENARLARVRGDSMLPTLQDRDLVLVDISQKVIPVRSRDKGSPLRADLYAIREGDLARIKRIERPSDETLVLHSDNVVLYPLEVKTGQDAENVNIIGKVRWWGHTVRE